MTTEIYVPLKPNKSKLLILTVITVAAGISSFKWRMLEEGYEGFGASSTLLNIQVF